MQAGQRGRCEQASKADESRLVRPLYDVHLHKSEQASKANASRPWRPCYVYVVYGINMSRLARLMQLGQLGHATLSMLHEYEQASETDASRLVRSHCNTPPVCYMRHD